MRETVANKWFKECLDVLFGFCDAATVTSASIKLPSPESLDQEMFDITALRFRFVVAGRTLRVDITINYSWVSHGLYRKERDSVTQ